MLKEDTKLEVELSGEIDSSSQDSQSGGSKSSLLGGMSLPVPVNLSQPAVKEWFGKRRANIRPLGEFFNTHNFQVTTEQGSWPSISIQVFLATARKGTKTKYSSEDEEYTETETETETET